MLNLMLPLFQTLSNLVPVDVDILMKMQDQEAAIVGEDGSYVIKAVYHFKPYFI